jgi:site-specific DNA recombinase
MNPTDPQKLLTEPEFATAPLKRAVMYLRVSTARQANKNGEAEGYSIPAQRAACARKAADLGAEVVKEYLDAGASARSADRPGLQELLTRVAVGDLDYVIVHKLDRLARDRGDDVAIALAIHKGGAVLVSTSEQIDESPAGSLLHGIMATIAEFYSKNLSHEAKKGIAEKARRGGTHGVAPLGYTNTLARIEGREVKGVAIDEERADHIRWAYAAYSTGDWSISSIRDALEELGLKSRTTQKFVGTPLSGAQVHRMLTHSYYIGKVTHKGVMYQGTHEPLISEAEWFAVQTILATRRISGDRAWKHSHYLKGSLTCGRCGGRMGFGHSRGHGGVYTYFFCLGRHTGRTNCDLPYVNDDDIEKEIEKLWRRVQFTPDAVQRVRQHVEEDMETMRVQGTVLAADQRRRLTRLERQKQKLIDAYLAEAITVEDLKVRQEAVASEISDAQRLIDASEIDETTTRDRIDTLIRLFESGGALYEKCSAEERRILNQAMFEKLFVDASFDGDEAPTQATLQKVASGLLSAPASAIAQLADEPKDGQKRTPRSFSLTEGSNVDNLAETVGFEPTEECKPLSTLAGWCTRPNYATSPVLPCHPTDRWRGGRILRIRKCPCGSTCPPFGGQTRVQPDA